ncbi:hypothetical protein IDH44_02370 [Paenibacillus sp. IB182496]|uniref:Pectate lyase superfamily protein domain-containing protein n=1 Tax=Paenibacillus sabuli TaxID=2772509 RepID=A0A927GQ58_9BACL|nr:hypothetical protein [Paenibacillus sabuli]MBD2844023.1 hypothetical protein [Paenibacillus sabuli]
MESFIDAGAYGFCPEASGRDNAAALQRALDQGGTVVIGRAGAYKLARTVYIGSHTSLVCGNGVFVEKFTRKGRSPMCCSTRAR